MVAIGLWLGREWTMGAGPRLVIVCADGPDRPAGIEFPSETRVIAADGGAELAARAGLEVDLAVGDFDSISAETLARVARVERHAVEKDASDLELALIAALKLEPERILVLGSSGGRLDHLLASLMILGADTLAGVQVDAQFGAAAVHVVRSERWLRAEPGELVSLFAVNGPATGVVTEGLVYPLSGETLEPGSSRGLSNVFEAADARVSVCSGIVLAVRPSGSVAAAS